MDTPLDTPPAAPAKKQESFLWEVVKFSLAALLIVLPIRYFVAQPFIVSGASMEPTFGSGEYLIIDELTYRFEPPRRGEVIVFRYPQDPSKFFIKRIVGLPGETVELRGTAIYIRNAALPDGFKIDQPYLGEGYGREDYLTATLGEGEYFVLGDNRGASSDSRVWGALPADDIVGRAFVRLLPLTRIDLLPGDASRAPL